MSAKTFKSFCCGHSNYQIGVNRTKSEIPSTKSGTFFGLAFFLMLIYRELNFDTTVLMLM